MWQKPHVIILRRGSNEEKLLITCKEMASMGPEAAIGSCYLLGCVNPCDVQGAS